jgi:hypothetical protein
MANISTSINKMNNDLSPQTIEDKKDQDLRNGNSDLFLGQEKSVAVLNLLTFSQNTYDIKLKYQFFRWLIKL